MLRRCLGLWLALAAPLLMGCAIPALIMESFGESVMPEVKESAEAYNQDLRWGRVPQAAAQMLPAQREQFIELFDGDQSAFHFTSVEVLSAVPKSIDGREVDVLVAWEFYSPPSLTERKLRQKQTWRFIELERRWEVAPDLGVFEAVVAARTSNTPVPASPQR
jgi:hypothetical protein